MPTKLYVIAIHDKVSGETKYVGIDERHPGMFAAALKREGLSAQQNGSYEGWWIVAPGQAADRPGYLDYTRFTDVADAVAWALRIQDMMERVTTDRPPQHHFLSNPWVREIS